MKKLLAMSCELLVQTFSTCRNSRSTGVGLPKILTVTFNRPFSGFTSSTSPVKFANGPSMTRTDSPRRNMTLCFGRSAPSSTCCKIVCTCSSGTGAGCVAGPTKRVTFGVFLTRYQSCSDISALINTYPGKNFRDETVRFPFLSSTTSSVGIITLEILSDSPKAAARCSILPFTLFSKPEYVWITYQLCDIACPAGRSTRLSDHESEQPLQRSVHYAEKKRENKNRY